MSTCYLLHNQRPLYCLLSSLHGYQEFLIAYIFSHKKHRYDVYVIIAAVALANNISTYFFLYIDEYK